MCYSFWSCSSLFPYKIFSPESLFSLYLLPITVWTEIAQTQVFLCSWKLPQFICGKECIKERTFLPKGLFPSNWCWFFSHSVGTFWLCTVAPGALPWCSSLVLFTKPCPGCCCHPAAARAFPSLPISHYWEMTSFLQYPTRLCRASKH